MTSARKPCSEAGGVIYSRIGRPLNFGGFLPRPAARCAASPPSHWRGFACFASTLRAAHAGSGSMIDVQSLTKDYGSRRAINDISFKVDRGEILGFLGPNGAGKTTTMRIITGFMPPTSGTVSVADFDIFRQSIQARRRIGYLPESVPLYTDMSVGGYLDFMAKIKGIPRNKRREQIEYVMDATHIEDRRRQLIGK